MPIFAVPRTLLRRCRITDIVLITCAEEGTRLIVRASMLATDPSTELTALLGQGTFFEGKLHFEGQLRIDGTFRGEIRSTGILILGNGSDVKATIDVGVAIVRGGICRGNIRASRSIELYVPAQVIGNLVAPEIFMDRGVQFSGNCSIEQNVATTVDNNLSKSATTGGDIQDGDA